jgi:hypothetical protein
MAIRTRSYSKPGTNGQRYYAGYWQNQENLVEIGTCVDQILEGNGGSLDITKVQVDGGILNSRINEPTGTRFVNWRLQALNNLPNDAVFGHVTDPSMPSNSIVAAKLLAETNPSRPVIDLPIAIYELREIPKLLKIEGDTLIKKFGSANLSYQFGWKPLLSDLLGLLNFSDEVDKRQKELEALAEGGLRRKRRLWSNSVVGSTDRLFQSLGYHCGGTVNKTSSYKKWGFVHWYPTNVPQFFRADKRSLARRAVLGLTVDFSTAWNAIPWSWLIDWCTNAGDILIANRNIVGATHDNVLIMTSSETTGSWYSDDPNVSNFRMRNTRKQRQRVTSISLDAQLPILSFRQLSILGSIGVTRRMPR